MFPSHASAVLTAEDDVPSTPPQLMLAMEMCDPDRQLGMLRYSLPSYGLGLLAARLANPMYAERFLTVLRRHVADHETHARHRAAEEHYRELTP